MYLPELDPTERQLPWTVYATPLMTHTTDLGLSIRVSMVEYRDVRLVTGTCSLVPWNGPGRRLVELTEGCYSEWDSQGVPG